MTTTYSKAVELVALAIDPWLSEADLHIAMESGVFAENSRVGKAVRSAKRALSTIAEILAEPTEAMVDAGADTDCAHATRNGHQYIINPDDVWCAMLSASPIQPEGK